MSMFAKLPALTLVAATLAGCEVGFETGLTPYRQSPTTVIATAYDGGRDKGVLEDGGAAIAYDPDGCQGWIIDDGVEGYAGRRFDPISGLPICDNQFPPGTVIRDYQTHSPGLRDYVPSNGPRAN